MLQCFTSNKKYKSKNNNRGELFKGKTLITYSYYIKILKLKSQRN